MPGWPTPLLPRPEGVAFEKQRFQQAFHGASLSFNATRWRAATQREQALRAPAQLAAHHPEAAFQRGAQR